MRVTLDEVRGYMHVDPETAARIRERKRSWCSCGRIVGRGWHAAIECAPGLHALDMAVHGVHAEHRRLGYPPAPERICELWAEAERKAQSGLRASVGAAEVTGRAGV